MEEKTAVRKITVWRKRLQLGRRQNGGKMTAVRNITAMEEKACWEDNNMEEKDCS